MARGTFTKPSIPCIRGPTGQWICPHCKDGKLNSRWNSDILSCSDCDYSITRTEYTTRQGVKHGPRPSGSG